MSLIICSCSSVFQKTGKSKPYLRLKITAPGLFAAEILRGGQGRIYVGTAEIWDFVTESGPDMLLMGWLVMKGVPVRRTLSWHGVCVPRNSIVHYPSDPCGLLTKTFASVNLIPKALPGLPCKL